MNPKKAWLFVVPLAVAASPAFGQQGAGIEARRTSAQVSVDGVLDEPAWASASPYDRFAETFPQDGVPAPDAYRTVVRVLFDDEFIYVGVRCHDPDPRRIVAQLSRRDTA